MIYVVLEIQDQDLPDIQKRLGGLGTLIKGLFKRPTQFCDPANHRGAGRRVTGFTRGRKFGWWVCAVCLRPTIRWSNNINAVLGAAVDLSASCECAEDEDCDQCYGTRIHLKQR